MTQINTNFSAKQPLILETELFSATIKQSDQSTDSDFFFINFFFVINIPLSQQQKPP